VDRVEFAAIQRKLGFNNQKMTEVLGIRLSTLRSYQSGIIPIPPIINNFMNLLLALTAAVGHIEVADQYVKKILEGNSGQ